MICDAYNCSGTDVFGNASDANSDDNDGDGDDNREQNLVTVTVVLGVVVAVLVVVTVVVLVLVVRWQCHTWMLVVWSGSRTVHRYYSFQLTRSITEYSPQYVPRADVLKYNMASSFTQR